MEKGWVSIMQFLTAGAVAAVIGSSVAVPVALAAEDVVVRVEGKTKTRVAQTVVDTPEGEVGKGSDAAKRCAGGSALGALERATRGSWSGAFSPGLGYFVDTIRGEKHPGAPTYWSLWVNGEPATAGFCDTLLDDRDEVLVFVDRCDYDAAAQTCTNEPVLPLVVSAPRRVLEDKTATVRVHKLTPAGKRVPVRGATVGGKGSRLTRTDGKGRARVPFTSPGRVTLVARKRGLVRSAPTPVSVTAK